jgi:transducin (beta)-like 1
MPVYSLIKPDYVAARRSSFENTVNGADDGLLSKQISKTSIPRRQVNGDAMEVDENGYGASEQVSEVESPLPIGHAVQALDTLTIGESRIVSTEKVRDLLQDSQILSFQKSSPISHSIWSDEDPSALVIAASDHLSALHVNDHLPITSQEIELPLEPYEVEAVCLLGPQAVAVSVGEIHDGDEDDDDEPSTQNGALYLYQEMGADEPNMVSATAGVIFALRYNPTSKLLLALTGDQNPLVSVFRYTGHSLEYISSKVPRDYSLYDAMWMDSSRFIACGTNTLQIFRLENNQINSIQTLDMKQSWFQIKYDPICDIAVLFDEEMKLLRLFNVETEDTRTHKFDVPISDFDFQPLPNLDTFSQGRQRLLATSSIDGTVQLWDVMNPFICVNKFSMPSAAVAMKISFSPDGSLLAAAGYDTVVVWRADRGGQPMAVWNCTDESAWRSKPGDDRVEWLHGLGWNLNGTKLVFTLADQVS